MRFILYSLLSLTLLITGCSGSEPTQKQGASQVKKQVSKVQKKTKKKVKKRKYPLLKQANIEAFLTSFGKNNPETVVELTTPYGLIRIRLYEDTPLHRANFIMLTKRNYFDFAEIYRVAPNFVVQGGDSDETEIRKIKRDIGVYRIPNEIKADRYHKRGAVAMTKEIEHNPEKKSSCFEFYIVVGKTYSDYELDEIQKMYNTTFSAAQREMYKTKGGLAHLDQEHTVFGEVISGMAVADSLSLLPSDSREWPLETVPISMDVIR